MDLMDDVMVNRLINNDKPQLSKFKAEETQPTPASKKNRFRKLTEDQIGVKMFAVESLFWHILLHRETWSWRSKKIKERFLWNQTDKRGKKYLELKYNKAIKKSHGDDNYEIKWLQTKYNSGMW